MYISQSTKKAGKRHIKPVRHGVSSLASCIVTASPPLGILHSSFCPCGVLVIERASVPRCASMKFQSINCRPGRPKKDGVFPERSRST